MRFYSSQLKGHARRRPSRCFSSEGLAKKGHSLARMSCIRESVQISVFLQICKQPMYTLLVCSRSVEFMLNILNDPN